MTIAYLHLVRLSPGTSATQFRSQLDSHSASSGFQTVVFSQVQHAVAAPQLVNASLLSQRWDCMLFLVPSSPSSASSGSTLPSALQSHISQTYTLKCAVSSALLASFADVNKGLHATTAADGAEFNAARLAELRRRVLRSSSQDLEASPDLLEFAERLGGSGWGARPVTMLNLLRFNAQEPGLESYKKYGAEFRRVGGRRGGNAKIVGKVLEAATLDGSETDEGGRWDELAIVHYPNIVAFCDMAAGEDYQEANHKYRLPALKDTLLFGTTEIPLAAEPGSKAAKL